MPISIKLELNPISLTLFPIKSPTPTSLSHSNKMSLYKALFFAIVLSFFILIVQVHASQQPQTEASGKLSLGGGLDEVELQANQNIHVPNLDE